MWLEWLFRILTLLCGALAGWSLGNSVPTWETDSENVRRGSFARGSWGGPGSMLVGGYWLAGTGSMVLWLIAASFTQMYAWPYEARDEYHWAWAEFFAHQGFHYTLLAMIPTYVWARLVDKGPVGPLE